eukprot:7009809-Prymnesium_polylepis.1
MHHAVWMTTKLQAGETTAGAHPYAEGVGCTCGSFASARSSLASPFVAIGAFSDGSTCGRECGGTELSLKAGRGGSPSP